MLIGELDKRVFTINDLATFRWDPLVYNPGEALYPLLTREVLPVPDRLRAIAARLELFPERLELARRQLEAPPRLHVETALNRHPGTVALVSDDVERLLVAEPGLRPLVEPSQGRALDVLGRFCRRVARSSRRPAPVSEDRPDLFGRRLALELFSSLPAEQVRASAQRRVEEIDEELEVVARRYLGQAAGAGAGAGGDGRASTVRAALDRIAMERPDDSTIVAAAEAALTRCTEAVRAHGIVSLPEQPMRIELMPVFRRGAGGAYCDAAGPLEEGGETSFAIEPTPGDWTPDQKASFYREYNDAMVTNLTVHEAMPGHMVQLALARNFAGSTVARGVLGSGTFIEGWAVHAERIMVEHGHGGLPVRLQQLKMQLRVAINAILDVSVHAGDLEEEGAVGLMMSRGYQEESEARGKWRRACLTSAQLSTYFVGYTELADLFAELGGHVGYDEVLAHGSPPPRLLRGLLRGAPRRPSAPSCDALG